MYMYIYITNILREREVHGRKDRRVFEFIYVYIYIYTYTCIHIHIYIYTCVYTYIHVSPDNQTPIPWLTLL